MSSKWSAAFIRPRFWNIRAIFIWVSCNICHIVQINEIGRALVNICNVVPNGVVAFVPSFAYAEQLRTSFSQHAANSTGKSVLTRLKAKKQVITAVMVQWPRVNTIIRSIGFLGMSCSGNGRYTSAAVCSSLQGKSYVGSLSSATIFLALIMLIVLGICILCFRLNARVLILGSESWSNYVLCGWCKNVGRHKLFRRIGKVDIPPFIHVLQLYLPVHPLLTLSRLSYLRDFNLREQQ